MEKLQDIVDELNNDYLSDDKLKKLISTVYSKYRKTITVTTLQVLTNTLKNMDKMVPLPFHNMQMIMLNIHAPQETIHKLVPNYQQEYNKILYNTEHKSASNYNKQRTLEYKDPYIDMKDNLIVAISGHHPGIIPGTPSMLKPPLRDQGVFSVYGNNLINNLGGIFW